MNGGSLCAENDLREKLGIPIDAERVLIFAESSHWDPNWLLTSEEYYDRLVRHNLDLAIAELQRDPRRIYSIECMFFLRMYWERNPKQHEIIRMLVNEGRLRMSNSGVTTADTLLPHTEAIMHGFLLGQEWLRKNGMTQEPKLAYFTDSFGCSPSLPSLLNAAGFYQTAITRIDGMYFRGCEINNKKKYPRQGSSAERLLKEESTLDFFWQDGSGAKVLCHWNAYTYGQGDLLAYRGISRIYIYPFYIPDRSDRNIARRIQQYTKQLQPYSRAPYMFCPIGFDFVKPIPDLVTLLERYNQIHFPNTGIWVVNAGLDDYLDLVQCHQDKLPTLQLDPNPYWTGFYTSRPALKKRCHEATNQLLLAEKLSILQDNNGAAQEINGELENAWWNVASANHHDFITGTSPDRIVEQEQIPWLEEAMRISSAKISQLSPRNLKDQNSSAGGGVPQWSKKDGRVEITTPYYHIELAEDAGGAIVRLEDSRDQRPLLLGLSNTLISYRETGGLWRMGYEFRGGVWKKDGQSSDQPTHLVTQEFENGLQISCKHVLNGENLNQIMWFRADSPLIHFRVIGRAAKRQTIAVQFNTDILTDELLMGTTGGVITRPPQRIYSPTFWPFQSFVHLRDHDNGHGIAIFQKMPGAIAYGSERNIQIVALRNALRERAFGFLPIPGNPAKGFEKDTYSFEYRLLFTQNGDWRNNDIASIAQTTDENPWQDARLGEITRYLDELITTDRHDVWVMASKPAHRGKGWIIRLYTLTSPGAKITLSVNNHQVREAILCDARERDLEPLEIHDGKVRLTMPGTIGTVRVVV